MKKLTAAIITGVLLLAIVVIIAKLIGGAVSLVSGLLNAILGIVVIAALIAIVFWMFSYAKKNK